MQLHWGDMQLQDLGSGFWTVPSCRIGQKTKWNLPLGNGASNDKRLQLFGQEIDPDHHENG